MNENVYQFLSNTVVRLHQFDAPPAPLADVDVDVTFKISNFYDFSLERLIQYEQVLQDLHTTSSTTTNNNNNNNNNTPVSASPPLRLLSDVRSSSSSVATLAVAVDVAVDAPSTPSTTLSSLPQQELTVKDLPSPSDALKFLRRNKSPRKAVLRSSRKRARQNTTGTCTIPNDRQHHTNTEHTAHQLDPVNLHEQEDVKRARTYTLPVLAVSDLYNPTPSSSMASPASAHSHSPAVHNKENKQEQEQVVVIQSTAGDTSGGAPVHTTPQKMALVAAVPACRTPKELEDELDDCKRQLLELKQVVSLLSSHNTTSAITT